MSKKCICKNCGDPVGADRNLDDFCSGQCRVEYELEHDRK